MEEDLQNFHCLLKELCADELREQGEGRLQYVHSSFAKMKYGYLIEVSNVIFEELLRHVVSARDPFSKCCSCLGGISEEADQLLSLFPLIIEKFCDVDIDQRFIHVYRRRQRRSTAAIQSLYF
ncbi:hypothetical protein MA16_Dca006765 [Dendrobium catenatum]|uniref:Uncharacterized protein n=1 Tax=Dendrobium catenatum TaxID=906689 RepID=A0A2I0W940_9ASPA|nr:hypothetical protein MA16_Dca006765 [Dendrobium catenatum]